MKLFVSYARKDIQYVKKLIHALKSIDGITEDDIFWDEKLRVGGKWRPKLEEQLNHSGLLIFVISTNSINSETCRWEREVFLKRSSRLVPVHLEDCPQANLDEFDKFHSLPLQENGSLKPIRKWRPQQDAYNQTAAGIWKAIQSVKQQSKVSLSLSLRREKKEAPLFRKVLELYISRFGLELTDLEPLLFEEEGRRFEYHYRPQNLVFESFSTEDDRELMEFRIERYVNFAKKARLRMFIVPYSLLYVTKEGNAAFKYDDNEMQDKIQILGAIVHKYDRDNLLHLARVDLLD